MSCLVCKDSGREDKCPVCNSDKEYVECQNCDGTGHLLVEDGEEYANIICPECDGWGEIAI